MGDRTEEKEDACGTKDTEKQLDDFVGRYCNNILSIKYIKIVVDRVKMIALKHPKKTSVFVSVFTIIFSWYIRTLLFSYRAGALSVYKIDKEFIKINDNIIYECIQYASITILLFFLNYIYLVVATSKKRKTLKLFLLWLFESIFLIAVIVFPDLKGIITNASYIKLKYIIKMLVLTLVMVLIINFFAIQAILYNKYIYWEEKHKSKKQIKDCEVSEEKTGADSLNQNNNAFIFNIIALFVIFAIMVPIAYGLGFYDEKHNYEYKCIKEYIDIKDSKYDAAYIDDENCINYAIVYENTDCYIVCPLIKINNKYKIVELKSKVISNRDVETYLNYDIMH